MQLLQLIMFIAGCHRSGTSLLAATLRELLSLSNDGKGQLQAALDNPNGFHESNRLVALNDELLELVGCSWSKPPLIAPRWEMSPLIEELVAKRELYRDLALNRFWLDKDPRISLTYPAYLHLMLRRVPVIAAIREPLAVACSLFARNGISVDAGLCLWFLYNHHLTSALDSSDPVIPYQRLMQAAQDHDVSKNLYSRIVQWLEKSEQSSADFHVWSEVITKQVQPNLDRSGEALLPATMAGVNSDLLEVCQKAYDCTLSKGSDGASLISAFDALPRVVLEVQHRYGICASADLQDPAPLRESLAALPQTREQLHRSLADAAEHHQQLESCVHDLSSQLAAMKGSLSWRITAPLRSLAKRLRS